MTGKKQKILYMTISDLKELGLLKNKSTRRSKNRKYYLDSFGKVKSVSSAKSFSTYQPSNNNATDIGNRLLLENSRTANDATRFQTQINNQISSISSLQDKDREINTDFQNRVRRYANEINKNNAHDLGSQSSSVGLSGNSDTFKNNRKPLIMNAQTNGIRGSSNTDNQWQLEQQSRNEMIQIQQKLDKTLKENNEMIQIQQKSDKTLKENNEMSNHNTLTTGIKPSSLRGNSYEEVKVEDVNDNEEVNDNEDNTKGLHEPKEEEFFHKDNVVYKNSKSKIIDLPNYKLWYKKIQKKKGEPLDSDIMNNNSDRGHITKKILKYLRNEYDELGGRDEEMKHEPNPNIIHKRIREMKHYRKAKPFEENEL